MENKKTPHIRKNINGSTEFYIKNAGFWLLLIFGIVFIFLILMLEKDLNTSIKVSTVLILLLFLLPALFYASKVKENHFFTLDSFEIKIKNKKYLYQNISEIYLYKKMGNGFMRYLLTFHFLNDEKSRNVEITGFNETERQILLEKLKEQTSIIEDTPAATTQIGCEIAKKIGNKKWKVIKKILFSIFLLILIVISNILNK